MATEQLSEFLFRIQLVTEGAGLFLLLLAETVIPLDPIGSDRVRARHVFRNFSLWGWSLLLGEALVGIWLLDIPGRLYSVETGLFRGADLPFPVLVVFGVLVLDLGEYVFHYLSHSQRWIWLFHAVHHSDDRLDVSTALRFHPGEVALNLVWKVGFFAALGLLLWLVVVRGLLMVPASLLQHANIRVPASVDRFIGWVFITPGLHKIHHSPNERENNTNFGQLFSFWDRLFGTLHETAEAKQDKYGLSSLREERWKTVRGMLATPVVAYRLQSL